MHTSLQFLHETLHSPLRLIGAGAHVAVKGQDYPLHKHPMWEIVYYRTGHIQSPMDDELYDCEPGIMLLTPPGMTHGEYARTAYSNFWIQIQAPLHYQWPRVCHDDADRNFERVCGALAREHTRQTLGRTTMLELLVQQLCILIERDQEHHQVSATERLVRDVERFFEEHHTEPLTMGEVARAVGIAPSTLRARFAQVRGISPMTALQRVRVRHAVGLIGNTTLTLETIASLCGYDSASHLSRYVKREIGRRPGEVRRDGIT